jgi:hypothetical protein
LERVNSELMSGPGGPQELHEEPEAFQAVFFPRFQNLFRAARLPVKGACLF